MRGREVQWGLVHFKKHLYPAQTYIEQARRFKNTLSVWIFTQCQNIFCVSKVSDVSREKVMLVQYQGQTGKETSAASPWLKRSLAIKLCCSKRGQRNRGEPALSNHFTSGCFTFLSWMDWFLLKCAFNWLYRHKPNVFTYPGAIVDKSHETDNDADTSKEYFEREN